MVLKWCSAVLFTTIVSVGASKHASAGLRVASLSIDAGHNAESLITLGHGSDSFVLAVGDTGSLDIRTNDRSVLSINSNGTVEVENLHTLRSLRVDGQLSYQDLSQW